MDTMNLCGHGSKIAIHILGYANRQSTDFEDANWIRAIFDFSIEKFTGSFELALRTEDFCEFKKSLTQLLFELKGQIAFGTIEDSVNIEISMGSRGVAEVKLTIKRYTNTRAELFFSFETDQSFLAETLIELEHIVDKYPIIYPA